MSTGSTGSVWLGGETTSRGVLRTRRAQGGDVAGLLVSAGAGLAVLLVGGSTMVAFLAAAGVVAVGAAVCVPWEPVRWVTGGSSVRGWVAARTGFTWRRLHGLTQFSPGGGVAAPAGVGSVTSTDEPVGGLVVGVTEPDRAADRRGRGRYLVTVVESQGDPARLRGRAGAGWSAFLEFLGSEVSLASHVSTVTSVTDWDPTDHVWLARQDLERVADPDATLVASYAAVVDEVARRAAAQRTWVVLRFPVTAALREHGEGEDGLRRAAAEQTVAAVERAAGLGLLMRPLDTRHQAALCRHLMDPEVSADDLRGLGGELGWAGAFPAFETSPDRRSLVVDGAGGRRWMTVWEVPAWTVAGQWLPQDFLYPVVTALSGRVRRSFVVTAELEPARRARHRARSDVASDRAALARERTEVTDGSEETQATSSQVRLGDLRPGTAAVGARWSMVMSFHASSEEERVAHERRVLAALADSYVEAPDRLRWRQDAALGLVMPVCRAWRRTLVERMLS